MSPNIAERPAGRRWHLVLMAVLGLGLAAAPAIFQMFDRAPGGGDMLADFEPYMTTERIDAFRADLSQIDAAHDEATSALAALPADQRQQHVQAAAFVEGWPAIDDDMRSMLATMEENIGNYEGVAALPPFWLFPFFFVLPGLLIAGVATWTLLADGGRRPHRGRRVALVVLGVGLIAAPVVFQMFTRAPGGAEMIADFEPFMTEDKVAEIQGYFLTIGGGEAELRRAVVPAVAQAQGAAPADVLPAVQALSQDWPEISGEMAPMVGTMADNVGNYLGIAALPPFWLFPFFFVIPGLIVATLGWRAGRTEVRPFDTAAVSRARAQLDRRDLARAAAASIAIVVLVAMGVLVVETGMGEELALRRPAPSPAAAQPAPPADPAPGLPLPATPASQVAGSALTRPLSPSTSGAGGDGSPNRQPSPRPSPESQPQPQPSPSPEPPPSGAELSCPLPLEPAPQGGGIASFTPLVPLFGPFSAEAFAMMPAFEPYFPLFGPMLLASEDFWAAADPALQAVIPPANELENAGFDAVEPHYSPHRQGFLAAESELAARAEPVGEQLVSTPGAGCLPALQAALLAEFGGGA